ncbi:hypothetical protein GOEFS_115_00470 [Gordonia effusa NBRC 100432]|uniref:Uncharacterized protein n=1 Tax=Gordonia effusa NBRC 100432 TaxID=1077974 RepID=H0R5Q6_9ACTN|nr:hypothetical protein [Gordonia effusa]GAB20407.1 hypothetical protein GOEFS_115_00470 [Gordonia effusa NBRC 100432]
MGDELERKLERNKDVAQEVIETTAHRVGRIATIITSAVADVAREIGELVTDGFEMRDAARRAKADGDRRSVGDLDDTDSTAVDDADQQALPAAQAEQDFDIIDAEVDTDEK